MAIERRLARSMDRAPIPPLGKSLGCARKLDDSSTDEEAGSRKDDETEIEEGIDTDARNFLEYDESFTINPSGSELTKKLLGTLTPNILTISSLLRLS
jgi:hypothetical protein